MLKFFSYLHSYLPQIQNMTTLRFGLLTSAAQFHFL